MDSDDRETKSALSFSGISRRRFAGGAAALTLAAPFLPLAFSTGSALAATPKQGGTARIAINDGTQTDSYDPAGWQTSFTQIVFGGALCNALTELAVDGSATPDLAESYTASGDLTTWTFKLRAGSHSTTDRR